MASDLLEDPRARIESAADKHGQFLREAERFVYRYVKGTLRGFDARDATQFKLQLPKPTDSCMTGRPRVLAAEIVEGVRSALDYIVFALSLRNNPEMKPRHPKFVIADDKASFDAQAKVALKHLGDSERAFVEALQPFSTNNSMLPLIRDAANRVKHRNLLTVSNSSDLEIVFGEIANKEEYKDWWCYPQDKGAAVYARGALKVVMLGGYDAAGLLQGMIQTGSMVVGAFDRYLTTGAFPDVVPSEVG